MSNISQSIFSFFAGELVSVVLAITVKDEKKRVWILIVGTILSGVLAFSLQGRVSATSTNSVQNLTLAIPTPIPTQIKEPSLTEITDTKGAQMELVSAGNFEMGSNNADNERPIHDVYLNAYYIDKFEVTTDMYVKFLNDVISDVSVESNDFVKYKGAVLQLCSTCDDEYYKKFRRVTWDGTKFSVIPPFSNHPIILVTWYGARNYCEWRGARLPTEAEWEKAAHGIDNRTYPWGEKIDCNKSNYTNSCVGNTTAVGSYKSDVSPYGVYDMAGNAWEWVADWYSDTYYQTSPFKNPIGPDTGFNRVLRGGSFGLDSDNAHSTFRASALAGLFDVLEGFRCVSDANP